MLVRVSRLALFGSLAGIPLALFSCEGEDRKFVESSGGTSGGGGQAGDASLGGSAGQGDGGPDGGTRCTQPSDCNDGDSCNGVETCVGGFCQSGTALANGTSCTPVVGSVISGGDAGDAGDAGGVSDAGDGGGPIFICANGACLARCESDDECNDNDVCTGNEICSPSTETCTSGTPKRCDDNNACTENKCDPIKECYYPLIDVDGDGHAAQTLGTCGDDCNDNDKTIYKGAAELCDTKDNNCNDRTDEEAPTWYPDCDGDTFAPAGTAGVIKHCEKPTTRHASCEVGQPGGWTSTAPSDDTTDCWDRDARVRPFTAADNNSAWQTGLISGRVVGVEADWNCDRREEQRYTVTNVAGDAYCGSRPPYEFDPVNATSTLGPDTKMIANQIIIIPPITTCWGTNGYSAATEPACNKSDWYSACEYDARQRKCVRSPTWKAQECR
ncbi:MAG TPA: putative metal-binding motif-containing protein [Polyangiaceae bacterium]